MDYKGRRKSIRVRDRGSALGTEDHLLFAMFQQRIQTTEKIIRHNANHQRTSVLMDLFIHTDSTQAKLSLIKVCS